MTRARRRPVTSAEYTLAALELLIRYACQLVKRVVDGQRWAWGVLIEMRVSYRQKRAGYHQGQLGQDRPGAFVIKTAGLPAGYVPPSASLSPTPMLDIDVATLEHLLGVELTTCQLAVLQHFFTHSARLRRE